MSEERFNARPRIGLAALAGTVLVFGLSGCFLDPTDVDNPRTTAEDLAQADEPTKALLPGLRAQFARVIRVSVVTTENVSDNYSIHGTGLPKQLDDPSTLDPTVMNSTSSFSTGLYRTVQELRALADFVIDEIIPGDDTSTGDQLAEAHYYRGMAYLIISESYSFAPWERDGTPVPAAQHLDRAIADLNAANSGAVATQAQAALARAYRWQGSAQAETMAAAVLASDPEYVFQQDYDATSIENSPYAYLFSRALQEMQPLPRLDFLDPKYLSREASIAVAKAEEMHLILAEADLANGNMAGGRAHLVDAINLAISRGTVAFTDNDARANEDLSIRPRDDVIMVRADANSPFIAGLVLNRPDVSIQVPPISATSLDPAVVAGLTDIDDVWHAFHLARQEILFLEARRMADLGIKLPIMEREIDANPNINDGDPGTTVVIPAYIPPGDDMDLFTPKTLYDGGLLDDEQILTGTEVTILVDMNRVLTDNRVSPFN